jgi:hypothetical protein
MITAAPLIRIDSWYNPYHNRTEINLFHDPTQKTRTAVNRTLCIRVYTLLALITSLVLMSGLTHADDVMRIFLFAGQSNMVGSDAQTERIDEFPPFRGAGAPQEDVLYSYVLENGTQASTGWVPLRPLNSFGPELTFARRVKQQISSPIGIIKSAVGGTTVAFDWNPDAPEKGQKLYPRTLKLIRESLDLLKQRGIAYQLEGVMWHQGENDMLDRNLMNQYAEGLKKLIARLRVDLQAPELKWYLAEVSEKGIWGMDHRANLGVLYDQQQIVLKSDSRLRWVPTSHLAFEVMGSGQPHYHFGTQGQLQLGEAFANAYLQEVDRLPPAADRRFPENLPVAAKQRVRLFVLAGQRNMEGEDSYVDEIPSTAGFESLSHPQEQVLYRHSLGGGVAVSTDWEPLEPNEFLGNFGPELSFGARLRKSLNPEEGIAIVKFTHSGAQSPDWSPRGSLQSHRNLYQRFVNFVLAAQQDLSRRGYDCQLEGVFWHTGENDTYFGPYLQNYAQSMKQLIDQSRIDLKRAELTWFITEQHKQAPWGDSTEINASLLELTKSDPQVKLIKTAHLPHAKRHFGTKGTLMLGEEMADAYLKQR